MRIGHHSIFSSWLYSQLITRRYTSVEDEMCIWETISSVYHTYILKHLPTMSKEKLRLGECVSFRVQLEIITHGLKFVKIRY